MLIILFLFLIAFRFSQSSCELIQVEPQQLRSAQLSAFNKAKPIRSDDKSILMKFSAYLEYDKNDDDGDKENNDEKRSPSASSHQQQTSSQWPIGSGINQQANSGSLSSGHSNATSAANNSSLPRTAPSQSNPIGFLNGNLSLSAASFDQNRQEVKKRFLPLDLETIEARHLSDAPNKHKYTLSFNCTKMNMVLVRQQERVFVESIKLELKVGNKRKTECDIQLPPNGAFAVGLQPAGSAPFGLNPSAQSTAGNQTTNELPERTNGGKNKEFVRFYCNKPVRYSCLHGGLDNSHSRSKGSTGGLLIGELHINAIEFETSLGSNGAGDEQRPKQVSKSEFKSKRSEY